MSVNKQIEHQTFSNIILSRNISLSKEDNNNVAIYFAFEEVQSPRLGSKYESRYEKGKQIVKQLINDLN